MIYSFETLNRFLHQDNIQLAIDVLFFGIKIWLIFLKFNRTGHWICQKTIALKGYINSTTVIVFKNYVLYNSEKFYQQFKKIVTSKAKGLVETEDGLSFKVKTKNRHNASEKKPYVCYEDLYGAVVGLEFDRWESTLNFGQRIDTTSIQLTTNKSTPEALEHSNFHYPVENMNVWP